MEFMKCPVCENEKSALLFQTDRFPYIGFAVSKEEKIEILRRYSIKELNAPLKVKKCTNCGHVFQSMKPNDKLMDSIYSEFYNYPSAVISGFIQKRENMFLDMFNKSVSPICAEGKLKNILEIACYDGYVLRELSKRDFLVCGCDPSKGADIAKEIGIKVYKRYFKSQDFIAHNSYFDVVIFRHFIEHVEYPVELLKDVKKVLTKKGLVVFETPNIEYFLENGSFESFNFQHIHGFSISSVCEVLRRSGLKLIEYKKTPENLIIIAAETGKAHDVKIDTGNRLGKNFVLEYGRNHKKFKKHTDPFIKKDKKIAIWGAGGFGGYLFPIYGLDATRISYIVDIDQRKWDMCFVNNNLKVYPPEQLISDPVDLIIVASMYDKEIVDQLKDMKIDADVINMRPKVNYIKGNKSVRK
ncbi:MAG: SAM-dependent methlyltransferase [Candidatus Saganbacteria bacterium]|uniref:SAM-dependent methlyltransferase n=1 Tax=Candidatus Saganbacteria bacterium TaxID=2575572 RepID=A0A833L2N5_UNCSA|nr:MAG: SAM-dependent methlyltransferase [Candidatus Saganbacteria bacterium]